MMNNPEFRMMLILESLVIIAGVITGVMLAGVKCGILLLITGMFIGSLFVLYTKKRYDKLKQLNTYLDTVLSGNYDLEIAENQEGELSILHDNIYKTTVLLRGQNEQLKADKRYLADVMADISHQLKTPVTSMSIMNDCLEYEKDWDRRQEFIHVQRQELDKMNWLIQNLLKLSKLDAGIIVLRREMTDLRTIINDSLSSYVIQMELRQIHLINQVEEVEVNVDRSWTIEVFRNIFKNCIEHMSEQGTLRVESEDRTLYLVIRISDDGCGIAPEDLPHIFERFYRGKDASPGSIGIGLALAKSILEKECAQISAESELEKGTTFEIRFYRSII